MAEGKKVTRHPMLFSRRMRVEDNAVDSIYSDMNIEGGRHRKKSIKSDTIDGIVTANMTRFLSRKSL
ncbi:Hypothetical predicted protein [Octopus vulgaris]|uniref:Uncharacterized protein n=1 Tax=Octopus vulgaris TaxID=6645 RepID=A0AA36F8M3_OCTVU|nr:Hypothetical predicted protein [Octopus vulgaris]